MIDYRITTVRLLPRTRETVVAPPEASKAVTHLWRVQQPLALHILPQACEQGLDGLPQHGHLLLRVVGVAGCGLAAAQLLVHGGSSLQGRGAHHVRRQECQ